jgi:hypothetical protein
MGRRAEGRLAGFQLVNHAPNAVGLAALDTADVGWIKFRQLAEFLLSQAAFLPAVIRSAGRLDPPGSGRRGR